MEKKNILITIIIVIIVIAMIALVAFLISNDKKQDVSNSNQNKTSSAVSNTTVNLVADEQDNIIIDTSNISNKATFYTYNVNGINIKLFAVKASDGTIRTAFNTCQVCNPSPKAYFKQVGTNFICQNCNNSFKTDDIGKESGGCNPIPITNDDRIDGENTITLTRQFVESYKANFES